MNNLETHKITTGGAIDGILSSKKALIAILSVVVAFLTQIPGLDVSTQDLFAILSPASAYIVGQGIADHGKSKAIIDQNKQLK